MATEPKKRDREDVPPKPPKPDVLLKLNKPPDVTQSVMEAQSSPVMVANKVSKLTLRIIKLVGLITLITFLATNKPLREKAVSVFESIRLVSEKGKNEAVFEWWREPHQDGKRSSGPQKVVITRDDEKVFNFEMFYLCDGRTQKSYFEGEKTGYGKMEGTWSQAYPEDGGHWYLIQDPQNPRLFKGSHSDKNGDDIKCSLKIRIK